MIGSRELLRVSSYALRRCKPRTLGVVKMTRSDPDAIVAEVELAAERAKVKLPGRHINDVKRMLPAPDLKPRRRWWSW